MFEALFEQGMEIFLVIFLEKKEKENGKEETKLQKS